MANKKSANSLDALEKMAAVNSAGGPVTAPVKENVKVEYKAPDAKEHVTLKEDISEVERRFFVTNPVWTSVEYSHTIPMRPYESAKISIGLRIPVGVKLPPDLEAQVNDTFEYATKVLEQRMGEEVQAIKKYVEELKKGG